ncbi:MAG: DUF1761 domain-containing protein [Terracidiphilus sp.]|jgi:hypothetical protein
MDYFHVNLLAVLVSAICQWLLGALWYNVVYAKRWRALVGYAEGEKPKLFVLGMIASFIGDIVLSFVLVHLDQWTFQTSFAGGISVGVLFWVGLMAPPLLTQHIFENRPFKLFAINAGYWLLAMGLGGGILAAWH